MHETSIAVNILGIAEEHCIKAGYRKIQSIRIKIGSASGILPDALQMAFDAAKTGTISEEAVLIINKVPLSGTCKTCGTDFSTEDIFVLSCPECSGTDFSINSGRELDITEIEVN